MLRPAQGNWTARSKCKALESSDECTRVLLPLLIVERCRKHQKRPTSTTHPAGSGLGKHQLPSNVRRSHYRT
ncbi:hypothetical protein PInf_023612 [Phytophthora infestans]|nr:hypothetical protein PInf_023612 [Phytophthora infestans]